MTKIDELNNLLSEITWSATKKTKKETEDSLLDLLIMAYVFGVDDVCNSLHKETKPDKSLMYASIYKQIDGKTWEKRLKEASTDEEIIRIAFTEAHRVFNEGQFDTGTELGAVSKVWHTQEDDRVRDSHWYLDGMEVGLEDYFYTLAGERALHPSGFGVPEEDIQCRCYLEYRG